MKREELIRNLNEDLKREYSHWHFYIAAAEMVIGPHREEFQEFFMKEAADEMQHIHEFGKLVRGLGGIPTMDTAAFQHRLYPSNVDALLQNAMQMESEVVAEFVQRMDQAERFSDYDCSDPPMGPNPQDHIDGRYVQIFLEEQMMDSRGTVDHLKQMLRTV